jgi:hypothetical protein
MVINLEKVYVISLYCIRNKGYVKATVLSPLIIKHYVMYVEAEVSLQTALKFLRQLAAGITLRRHEGNHRI